MPSTTLAQREHRARWWAMAGALPLLAFAAVLVAEVDHRLWFALPHPVRSSLAGDALVLDVALVVIAAPLAGVAALSRSRRPAVIDGTWPFDGALSGALTTVAPLLLAIVSLIAVSAAATFAAWGATRGALGAVTVAHATFGAATLALGMFGALCASVFRDALDAAAASLAVAFLVAWGLLAAGPAAGDLPTPLVNAALLASPVVATASAAGIDLLRTDWLYQLSPLAHLRFDYPTWHFASAFYLVVASCCFAGTALSLRSRRTCRPS